MRLIGKAHWLAVLVFGAGVLAAASPALAAEPEVEAHAKAQKVSIAKAEAYIELQTKADAIESEIRTRAGSAFAGVWLDPKKGRLKVVLTNLKLKTQVTPVLQSYGINGSSDILSAKHSLAQLETGQDRFNATARSLLEDQKLQSAVETSGNAISATVSKDLSSQDKRLLSQAKKDAKVTVKTETVPPSQVSVTPTACSGSTYSCDRPFRGGVKLRAGNRTCSAGFPVRIGTRRYVSTAAHCVWALRHGEKVRAYDSSGTIRDLGPVDWDKSFFGYGDEALIRVTGSYWNQDKWQSKVARWNNNVNYEINGSAPSKEGKIVCRTGVATGTQCGYIKKRDVAVCWTEPSFPDTGTSFPHCVSGLVRTDICSLPGDSGGAVTADHKAMGVLSSTGKNSSCPSAGAFSLYSEGGFSASDSSFPETDQPDPETETEPQPPLGPIGAEQIAVRTSDGRVYIKNGVGESYGWFGEWIPSPDMGLRAAEVSLAENRIAIRTQDGRIYTGAGPGRDHGWFGEWMPGSDTGLRAAQVVLSGNRIAVRTHDGRVYVGSNPGQDHGWFGEWLPGSNVGLRAMEVALNGNQIAVRTQDGRIYTGVGPGQDHGWFGEWLPGTTTGLQATQVVLSNNQIAVKTQDGRVYTGVGPGQDHGWFGQWLPGSNASLGANFIEMSGDYIAVKTHDGRIYTGIGPVRDHFWFGEWMPGADAGLSASLTDLRGSRIVVTTNDGRVQSGLGAAQEHGWFHEWLPGSNAGLSAIEADLRVD